MSNRPIKATSPPTIRLYTMSPQNAVLLAFFFTAGFRIVKSEDGNQNKSFEDETIAYTHSESDKVNTSYSESETQNLQDSESLQSLNDGSSEADYIEGSDEISDPSEYESVAASDMELRNIAPCPPEWPACASYFTDRSSVPSNSPTAKAFGSSPLFNRQDYIPLSTNQIGANSNQPSNSIQYPLNYNYYYPQGLTAASPESQLKNTGNGDVGNYFQLAPPVPATVFTPPSYSEPPPFVQLSPAPQAGVFYSPPPFNVEVSEVAEPAFIVPDTLEKVIDVPLPEPPKVTNKYIINDGKVQRSEVRKDNGEFISQYTTADGISRTDEGNLVATPGGDLVLVLRGSYSFISPEGLEFRVDYTADQNGYRPVVQPPVPAKRQSSRPTNS